MNKTKHEFPLQLEDAIKALREGKIVTDSNGDTYHNLDELASLDFFLSSALGLRFKLVDYQTVSKFEMDGLFNCEECGLGLNCRTSDLEKLNKKGRFRVTIEEIK